MIESVYAFRSALLLIDVTFDLGWLILEPIDLFINSVNDQQRQLSIADVTSTMKPRISWFMESSWQVKPPSDAFGQIYSMFDEIKST